MLKIEDSLASMTKKFVKDRYLLRAVNSRANVREDDEVATLSKEGDEHPDGIASQNRGHKLDCNTNKYLNGEHYKVDGLKVQLVQGKSPR